MDTDSEDLGELTRRQAATIESLRAEVERLTRELELARPARRSDSTVEQARRSERRFGLADSLILVAATAIGLGATRMMVPDLSPEMIWDALSRPSTGEWTFNVIVVTFAEITLLVMPCVAAWTLACVVIRLRAPRPVWRRVVRQPGAMACLVATVMLVLSLAAGLVACAMTGQDARLERAFQANLFASILVGVAIAWCWVTMALRSRSHPQSTWIDRLGRFIGAAWVITAIVDAYIVVVFWPF